jgi:hypothetical protein
VSAAVGCGVAALLIFSTFSPPGESYLLGAAACPASTAVEFNNTSYWGCGTSIDWNSGTAPRGGPTAPLSLTFHGVAFVVTGSYSIDCGPSTLNVTGTEASSQSHSLIVVPTPYDCHFSNSPIFSPDAEFGAIYQGGSPVTLLVRAR